MKQVEEVPSATVSSGEGDEAAAVSSPTSASDAEGSKGKDSKNKYRDPVECSPPDKAAFDEAAAKIQEEINAGQAAFDQRNSVIEKLQVERDASRARVREAFDFLEEAKTKRSRIYYVQHACLLFFIGLLFSCQQKCKNLFKLKF